MNCKSAHTCGYENNRRPSCVASALRLQRLQLVQMYILKHNLQHLCCASLPCLGAVHVYRWIYASLVCRWSLPEFSLTHHRDADDNLCHFSDDEDSQILMFLQSSADSDSVDLFTVDAVIGSGSGTRCLFLVFIQPLVQIPCCFTDTGLQTAHMLHDFRMPVV